MVHYDVPYPLGEIVRKILARGDDRAGTMPQESRAWSKKRLAGWRTDQDVAAQLAALTSLDFNQYALREHRTFNREEEAQQWAIQNNLAHLLEHTPGLKTLHVPLVFAEGGAPFPFAESGWGLVDSQALVSTSGCDSRADAGAKCVCWWCIGVCVVASPAYEILLDLHVSTFHCLCV